MIVASGGGHTRQVNGILGLLCKEHFPGLVEYAGVTGPTYLFDHYAAPLMLQIRPTGYSTTRQSG